MLNDKKLFKKIVNSSIESNKILSKDIVSVYLYGSFSTGETSKKSDVDCYFVAKNIKKELLEAIGQLKKDIASELKREVFVNVISVDDLNSEYFEKGFFSHRDRPYLFLFEFETNFKLVYGKDLIKEVNFPTFFNKNLKKECIRLIRNFRYMNYKLITNAGTKLYSKEAILKNVLFASKIFEIFYKNNFKNYKDSALFISDKLKNNLALEVYGYLKEEKNTEEKRDEIMNGLIDFYNQILESVQEEIIPKKRRSGCIEHGDMKVYFDIDQSVLDKKKDIPVIVFLNGMPRFSKIEEVADCFIQKGFAFLNVFYPGYWEGSGKMSFSKLPEQISSLGHFLKNNKLKDLFSEKDIDLHIGKIYLVGSSFGATVALNVESDAFDKIVAVSPLVNFESHKDVIDDLFGKFDFFSNVIRFKEQKEAIRESFYKLDPLNSVNSSQPEKILIISDKSDDQINFSDVESFASDKKIKLVPTNFISHGYKILKYDDARNIVLSFLNNYFF